MQWSGPLGADIDLQEFVQSVCRITGWKLSYQDRSMPRGPKGQKRPADVIGNAVRVMQIATGEAAEDASAPSVR